MGERLSSSNIHHAYTIEDLRQAAKNTLPKGVFDFYDGAAEDEDTLKNRSKHCHAPRQYQLYFNTDRGNFAMPNNSHVERQFRYRVSFFQIF